MRFWVCGLEKEFEAACTLCRRRSQGRDSARIWGLEILKP